MTRPWRRITLHLSQIALTLGLTFTGRALSVGCLLVAVDDPTPSAVVRRQLHHHTVLGEDPDVVLAHLAAEVGEDLVPVAHLTAEHGIRQGLRNGALELDHACFLRHVLHNLSIGCLPWCTGAGLGRNRVAREPPPRAVVDLVRPLREPHPRHASEPLSRASSQAPGQPRGTTKQTHVGPTRQFTRKLRGNTNSAAAGP